MILSGVVAASAGGFVATGGNEVLTQNGYRYHIFTSSGTFTISSGEKTLSILTINGGSAGAAGSIPLAGQPRGGTGGSGGSALIGNTTSPVSSSFAVTVAGAGGTSSVTPSRNTTSISGGAGGLGAAANANNDANYTITKVRDSSPGGSVPLYNTRGVPWSLLTFDQFANAGGGGGGASVYQYANSNSMFLFSSGSGTSGYNSSKSLGAQDYGVPGPANSGGGGAGGWAYQDMYGGFSYGSSTSDGGAGGSGIVIIAYQLG